MNIVIVNDFAYVDGGASKVALSSALALAQHGHHVTLFSAVGPISRALLNVANLEVVCLHQHEILQHPSRLHAALQGLWNRQSADAFAKLLARFSPGDTLVHLHTWTKAHSASVMHAASRLGFRIVLTLHDYFSACPNGGFFLYPSQQLCQLRPMSPACLSTQCDSRSYSHKLWRVARQWVQSGFGGLPADVDGFISISDTSEAILQPYLPQGKEIYRVPNPIDLPPGPAADPSASERFSFVGRLAPEKGPALLAKCAEAGGFPVVFVGDGPEQKSLSAVLPSAEFTGWLESQQVVEVLRTSRALVFPSLWYETQGLTVAEAAALGVPAIVSSQTAAREWVVDGVTGLLFQHGDQADLHRKMLLLHQHPELAKQMGQNAYERYWRDPFTMNRHCAALVEVYERTLAGPPKEPTVTSPSVRKQA